jgi:VWFA-related protein
MIRCVLTALLCAVSVTLTAQQPTFSSRREVVRIDVLVTDRDRPVHGLTAADFEIIDSGVPQEVEFVSFEELPLNVALVLDASASITPDAMRHLREAGSALLENLRRQDQAALLTFGDAIVRREPLTADAGAVRARLEQVQAGSTTFGGTALIDATYAGMTLLSNDAARGLLIAFTDGVDTSSWLEDDRVLQIARRSNLVAYGISTGELRKGSFLRDLSDVTGGGAFEIKSTDALRKTFVEILDEFRQRYLVSFSPANVPADGWHPLTVRVKNRRVDVKARVGYAT